MEVIQTLNKKEDDNENQPTNITNYVFSLLLTFAILAGCGGGGSSTSTGTPTTKSKTLTGTASAGAPIVGTESLPECSW